MTTIRRTLTAKVPTGKAAPMQSAGFRLGALTAALAAAFTLPGGAVPFALSTGMVAMGILAAQPAQAATTYTVSTLAGDLSASSGYIDGSGSAAKFYVPRGVAVDVAGNIYIADSGNNRIRKVTPGGTVTTLAGSGAAASSNNTDPLLAAFNSPQGIAVDTVGNVYVGDNIGHCIRKIAVTTNAVTTLAGLCGVSGVSVASATKNAARFYSPAQIVFDGNGDLLVVEVMNHTIRKINIGTPGDVVTLVAGRQGVQGAINGDATTTATFKWPWGIAVGATGTIYVNDGGNNCIRQISSGTVSTFAGLCEAAGTYVDGDVTAARFNNLKALAADTAGNLYVSDYNNSRIRKIDAAGNVTTVVGIGGSTSSDGDGTVAGIYQPFGLALDSASGNFYITNSSFLRKVTVAVPNAAPVASAVTITGTATVGQSLAGTYTYSDTDTPADSESGSTYRWYRQDDTGGTNRAAINGVSGTTAGDGTIPSYTLTSADGGKYLVVGVVPKQAGNGDIAGTEAFSAATAQVPAVAPSAPTGITPTTGNAQLSVVFTPGTDGGSAITGYSVSCTSSDGGTAGSNTGSASPIVVSGLTNGKSYTCTVTATNAIGTGSASTASTAASPAVLPELNTPSATSTSANLSTFGLQADSSGTAYFTVLAGAGTCPAAAAIEAHSGSPLYWGSTPLTAATAASYTLRNLTASTAYKLCAAVKSGATYSTVQEQTFTTSAATALGSTWSAVGGAGFSAGAAQDVSLSIAPGGTLYVAYQDGANSDKTTVMKYSGGVWSLVGSAGFSAGAGVNNSLTFAPDGTPYVAYRDNGNSSKVTVMKFDGANWVVVGSAGFSVGTVSNPSLSFAPDGTPYLAFVDNGNGTKATVMKFDGANWVEVGSVGFSAGLALLTSLAFAPDGTPYVAYKEDQGSNKATVMKFDGTNWVAVGSTAFSTGAITSLSLAITPVGTPYVAYRDGANSLKATVMKFDGANWVAVGSAGFTAGSANYVKLAFAPDGTPYLAYRAGSGTNRVNMAKFSGDTWSAVGNANFSADDAGNTSLALAPDGTPYVAYDDYGNSQKVTVMKLAADATAPDAPTGVSATAGNGSASIAFTPPENNGGAAITEYTASCAPANQFAAVWTASQTGSGSPITVSGLTNGTAYKCEVKASNSAGYGNYSSASNSVTPTAPVVTQVVYYPPPPPPNQVDLPTGGGTAKPTEGQTVTVTDNGKEGSGIDLPPPPMAPANGTTKPPPVGVNISLPGTGTVGVSSDSADTKLGVQGVKLPGETTTVSTVMVTQGSASFTATKEGQPVASLKNGIFVVSGATDSKVTVDATGPDTKIGVTSSDTIVVPTGSKNVSGTSVDLPPPTATGGAASTISVKIGNQNLTVQSSQADTKMTFKVVDIGGVQTPILEVTGSAQVTGSGDNQPIVSIAGNVIKTGKGKGGGSSQVCNTIVQASSDSSSDVVHVVTCYIVLEAGTFSAMNGGGNGFAAIKDGIVWAGETAEFDKNGKVTSAYLGSRLGLSDAVGDDVVPGGAKFAGGGYNLNAFIPRIAGTPLRLNGAKLDERIFSVINQALGVTVQPALPVQSDQGVLNFTFNGSLNGLGVQNTQVNYTLNRDTASIVPSRRIRVDTSRADGVSISAEGEVDVATGGLITTFTPSVADPKAFAEKISQTLPGATITQRWNGTWHVTAADGATYVGRPQWSFWPAAPGAATFSTTPDGNLLYSDNGRAQPIFPDFYDYDTLQATFRTELKDPALTVLPRMDGTATATVNGQTYTLAPQWNLIKPAAGKPAWWVEGGVVYIKNADGSAQGFTVK